MSPIRVSRAVAVVALGAIAACSADSSIAPQSAGLDAALAEMSPSSLPGASSTLSLNQVPVASAIVPSSCSYNSGTQSFSCPNVTVSGVTVTRAFTLLDASGASQSAYDKSTTNAVRVNTTANGSFTSGSVSATVSDTNTMTLSGLLSGTHVLDGTDHAHVTTGGATSTTMNVSTTIAGLVLPSQRGAWPAAGTITTTSALASSPTVSAVTVKLSFSGTSKVAVTITTALTTKSCTMDLANPAAGCV